MRAQVGINILGGNLYGNNGIVDENLSLQNTGVLNPGDGNKEIGDLTILRTPFYHGKRELEKQVPRHIREYADGIRDDNETKS